MVFNTQKMQLQITCILMTSLVAMATGLVRRKPPVPLIVCPAGKFLGKKVTVNFDGESRRTNQFLGIPYAEAPTGNLRFSKPVTKAPLAGTFDARNFGPVCPQQLIDPSLQPLIDEDCLRLNIYIPIPRVSFGCKNYGSKPVMVYLYGGFYTAGASNTFDGSILSAFGDVIVVTLNYRLSVFGFLSTGDTNSPGNYGLWDQRAALLWIQTNIEAFGGDKTQVTLFGTSSGSASVFYQSTYPGNVGLFQRVIGESFAPTSPSAFAPYDDEWVQFNSFFASTVQCNNSDSALFVACLQSKSVEEIMTALAINDGQVHVRPPFLPMIDGALIKIDPRLLFSPGNAGSPELATFSNVDVLTGVNDDDGILQTSISIIGQITGDPTLGSGIPSSVLSVMVPVIVDEFFSAATNPVNLIIAILSTYTPGDLSNATKNRDDLFDIITDAVFTAPAIATATLHSSLTSSAKATYFYQFVARPSYEPIDWIQGARHIAEVPFVFGFLAALNNLGVPNAMEVQLSKDVMAAWTNFAKTGDPSSADYTWPQFDASNQQYTEIDVNGFASQAVPMSPDKLAFWLVVVPTL